MKILALPYTHTLSHVSRPLSVARELRRRGHEVIFAGSGSNVRFIRDEGFEVLPLYEPDPEMLFGNIRKGRLRFVSDSEIERMVEADLLVYKEVRPALVLTDGRFSAAVSSQIAGLRHAAIVNVSSTEYRAHPYVPFFGALPRLLRGTGFDAALNGVNLKTEMLVFDNAMSVFKRLTKKHGLRRAVTATNCLAGADLTLLADIPEYFPTKRLPENYHYIGPLTWKPSFLPPPQWWPPPSTRPLIYITMGTTGIGGFFNKAAGLFSGVDFTAVITTGAQARAGSAPANVRIEPYMDGDMVMERCSVVVCHGGNGTIYQALQQGKPVIGLPTIPDQRFNMRRVEARHRRPSHGRPLRKGHRP
jgi:UDP:flavonoid glycosyltransferase YjiC (YdhE family)